MKRYARFLIPAVLLIGVLAILLVNLSSALVYYNTPSEVLTREVDGARLRLAGRVVPGSVSTAEGEAVVTFTIEDCEASIAVRHVGVPPQLFAEGTSVVVEGTWTGQVFESNTLLVKHDEQYRSDSGDYDPDLRSCSDL